MSVKHEANDSDDRSNRFNPVTRRRKQSNVRAQARKNRCMAMLSVMADCLEDQNSGPIFRRLWSKVHRIKFECDWMSVVCNAVFRLTMLHSGDIRDQVAKLSEIAPKFWCFWAAKFRRGGEPPKFLTEFCKPESPSNMWQSLVTIGQATRILGGEKRKLKTKEDLSYSGKT